MKKSIISALGLSAMLFGCITLQSCADTTSQTTYTTAAPGEAPVETTTTTTTDSQPDSVVGATANAAGTIVAAPFRIVGDTLGVIF